MSELSKVHNLISSKVHQQNLDRSISTAEALLKQFDCLHLRDEFIDSIKLNAHPVAKQSRYSNDALRFNDNNENL